MHMRFASGLVLAALALAGCLGPQVRPGYDGPARSAAETAVVHPSSVGALVMIQTVDDKNTYGMMEGYLGPVSVLPGTRTFRVEVTIGVDQPRSAPAEMAPPPGAQPVVLQTTGRTALVDTYRAQLTGQVDAGKEYELRYGYVVEGDRKQHVLWLEPRRPPARQ